MDILLIVIALSIIPLFLFAVHIWRDIRGRMRNKRGHCYACGNACFASKSIHHHGGGVYTYCSDCGERHGLMKGIAYSLLGLVCSITMAIIALDQYETDLLKAVSLAIGAILIIILIAFALYRKLRGH